VVQPFTARVYADGCLLVAGLLPLPSGSRLRYVAVHVTVGLRLPYRPAFSDTRLVRGSVYRLLQFRERLRAVALIAVPPGCMRLVQIATDLPLLHSVAVPSVVRGLPSRL